MFPLILAPLIGLGMATTTAVAAPVPVPVVSEPQDFKSVLAARFGADSPMLLVAFCESTYRQFDAQGQVVTNFETGDYGLFQINGMLWADFAESKGWNIDTVDGNIAMAEYLYQKYGLKPWSASAACIKKNTVRK